MTEHIRIRGTVQGVGFRPTVARLARAAGLDGWVRNDGDGVLVTVRGPGDVRDRFLDALLKGLPPLARVIAVDRAVTDDVVEDGFSIVASAATTAHTAVAADAATCEACSDETGDPFSRRYRYPFTNCTHCGPRFTITTDIPYDRPNTTMAGFTMCVDCQSEYDDETDRRYHAQPIACGRCGPTARLVRTDGSPVSFATYSMLDDVDAVRTLLQRGELVTVKGIGGYQLCCDALNRHAVSTLRSRKQRPDKPFALMAEDLDTIRRFCTVSDAEAEALTSPANPIVLLRADGDESVAPEVAPGQALLGFMLPPTPLHALMLRRIGRPIVCTSGNLTDEPQCIDDTEVMQRLGGIADWALVHDRPIAHRVDDSVVRVLDGQTRLVRRARGYAPAPIVLHKSFANASSLTALGGHLKSTFALLDGDQVVLSPHIGDLDDPRTVADYHHIHETLGTLFAHTPKRLVMDRHPAYATAEMVRGTELPVDTIDHHHAHLASCLADNGVPVDTEPVLGILLDGLGLGPDDGLWGGELLVGDYRSAERVGGLPAVPMLGGNTASREPWRNAIAHLVDALGWSAVDRVPHLAARRSEMLEQALERSPGASSTGRLFDAVAAILDIVPERISFEAQAPMALEALVSGDAEPYPIGVNEGTFDLAPMWSALLDDVGVQYASHISARFHAGLAHALACAARPHRNLGRVALSGGVWQNAVLLHATLNALRADGWDVLVHRQVPPNDGGLALGQATIAAARALQE